MSVDFQHHATMFSYRLVPTAVRVVHAYASAESGIGQGEFLIITYDLLIICDAWIIFELECAFVTV